MGLRLPSTGCVASRPGPEACDVATRGHDNAACWNLLGQRSCWLDAFFPMHIRFSVFVVGCRACKPFELDRNQVGDSGSPHPPPLAPTPSLGAFGAAGLRGLALATASPYGQGSHGCRTASRPQAPLLERALRKRGAPWECLWDRVGGASPPMDEAVVP